MMKFRDFTQKWYYWVFCIVGGTIFITIIGLFIDYHNNWSGIFAPVTDDPNVIVITTGKQVAMLVGLIWFAITVMLEREYRNK